MVQLRDTDVYTLSEGQKLPGNAGAEAIRRQYKDVICLTKAAQSNNPIRCYRSTYDFSAPKRYKTVVQLEPRLAPIRYYRAINYGIPRDLRHKSTVDCDFRPRPRAFSETTWIFPKQGKDAYTSTVVHNQLIDSTWYKSQVIVPRADNSDDIPTSGADYASTDEGVFAEETSTHDDEYTSSEDEDCDYVNRSTTEDKRLTDKAGVDSMSLSSDDAAYMV